MPTRLNPGLPRNLPETSHPREFCEDSERVRGYSRARRTLNALVRGPRVGGDRLGWRFDKNLQEPRSSLSARPRTIGVWNPN